jgi:Protein of unknown function (DUF3617)
MTRTALLALLALAACNKGPSVSAENASVADVAAKVEAANGGQSFVSPGQWKTTMTIQDMTIPGMPPQMAEKMKSHVGQGRTFETCLTPEQAKKPKADFFAGADKSCRYDKFEMGSGKIEMIMQCAREGGAQTMVMNGTYSADSYHMAMTSTGTGAPGNPMAGMSMKMEMDAKRTGECTGKENG